ncbi:ATP-binding protein [bacterium]|nr:ATP-binding protein [bacterium]
MSFKLRLIVTPERNSSYLQSLVRELCALPYETEWVEFKLNDNNPEMIGEYISALSNAATLVGKAFAYIVWGVDDRFDYIPFNQGSINRW